MIAHPLLGRTLGSASHDFAVAEWTEPGDSPGPPRPVVPPHVHHDEDEAWYVLEGTLAFRLGDREVRAPAGSAVLGPRGVPHTFWNPGADPARYLVVMRPKTARLVEELALHSGPARTAEEMQAIFRRFDCELLE